MCLGSSPSLDATLSNGIVVRKIKSSFAARSCPCMFFCFYLYIRCCLMDLANMITLDFLLNPARTTTYTDYGNLRTYMNGRHSRHTGQERVFRRWDCGVVHYTVSTKWLVHPRIKLVRPNAYLRNNGTTNNVSKETSRVYAKIHSNKRWCTTTPK